ncbi:MAG: DUF4340 domain-containing protein [Clostridia bacterium]|nr:DUF4340 domain-containing protein [Clostridia bacterium]
MSEFENKNENEGGIFDEPKERLTAKKKHRDDFKRQLKITLTVLLIAVALALAYFLVIKPIAEHVEEAPEEEVELLEGEVLGPQNRILIMEYLKKDDIASVEVSNAHGKWGFVYDETDDEFYVKDNKSATYDRQKLAQLLSAAGYTLAIERIVNHTDNFGEYGLSELDDPAYYIITDRKGNSHKLYIGNIIPSNAGYYVRYDGRSAVYVLDHTIAETLLMPLENMIMPTLAFPVNAGTYHTITNFALKRDGELVIALEYIENAEKKPDGSLAVHRFLYPEQYVPNDINYLDVFALFQDYSGLSTLVYKPTLEDLTEYGLDKPKYDLYFEYMGIPTNIIFSEKNKAGNYYAYSPIFDLITEVEGAKADWLDWGLIDWIERPLFQMNISAVDSIELVSGETKYKFTLESDENGLKAVREEYRGRDVENIDNFKKFYQTILMTSLQDYVNQTEEELASLVEGGEYLSMNITLTDGSVKEYKFYPYETRRSYYTVNGKGDFYILRDRMVKILDDAQKVMTGEQIYPDANN